MHHERQALTYIHGSQLCFQVFIKIRDSQSIDGRGTSPVQQLREHQKVSVAGQRLSLQRLLFVLFRVVCGARSHVVRILWSLRVRGIRLAPMADVVLVRRFVAVVPDGEVRKREEKRPEAQQQHSGADPSRLVSETSEVGDRQEAGDAGDVVAAGDQARLRARQFKSLLDRRDDDADEAVDDHSLKHAPD